MDVMERLRLLVADVLELEPDAVDGSAGKDTLPEWDSLAHLRIVGAVEEEFGVKLTMQEIGEMTSLAAIGTLVERHRA